MSTITIELDEKRLSNLKARAEEAGMTPEQLARELLEDFTEEPSEDDFTPAQRAAIEAGLEDIRLGRVKPHEEVFARLEARYRK